MRRELAVVALAAHLRAADEDDKLVVVKWTTKEVVSGRAAMGADVAREGSTFSKGARAFAAVLAAKHCPAGPGWYQVVTEPQLHIDKFWDSDAMTPEQLRRHTSEMFEVFEIDADDPRRKRRDNDASSQDIFRGVRATHDLPAGIVLLYDGHVTLEREVHPDIRRDERHPARKYLWQRTMPTGDGHHSAQVCVFGNPLGRSAGPIVNDASGTGQQVNCGFMPTLWIGDAAAAEPQFLLAMITRAPLKKGQELLVDYGATYDFDI